jgi:Ser/Thr protein kinase RdoA (MazF antagonist)
MDFIEDGKAALLKTASDWGLGTLAGLAGREIDTLSAYLNDPRYTGLVHSDACPDNTQITDGTCRLFDFETSGWGPVALDAAYLLLPFPSCWCFAELPADVSGTAMSEYRSAMSAAGVAMGPEWDASLAAALATLITARGRALADAVGRDNTWGTTTIRPRILTWLRGFVSFFASAAVAPRLHELAAHMLERLESRWPSARVPSYPALAMPGDVVATIPGGWDKD